MLRNSPTNIPKELADIPLVKPTATAAADSSRSESQNGNDREHDAGMGLKARPSTASCKCLSLKSVFMALEYLEKDESGTVRVFRQNLANWANKDSIHEDIDAREADVSDTLSEVSIDGKAKLRSLVSDIAETCSDSEWNAPDASWMHFKLSLKDIQVPFGCSYTNSFAFEYTKNLVGRSIQIDTAVSSFGKKILHTSQTLTVGYELQQHVDFCTEFFNCFLNGMQQRAMTTFERELAWANLKILQTFRLVVREDISASDSGSGRLILAIVWEFERAKRSSGLTSI
ncbi:MAG: hypothetical protein SGCHY_002173 [Lobulomycetales sp.]